MKMITKYIWAAAGAAALAAMPAFAGSHGSQGGHGTDILHFSTQASFQNTGVETNASGSVQADQNTQGNANNQKLDISVAGLTASTTYGLYAVIDGSSTPTFVDVLTTDAKGHSTIQYQSAANGHGNGNGNGHGKGKASLPDALNPISSIHELDIVDTNTTTTVLTADFSSTNKFQYLVKRAGSTNGVSAELRLKDVNGQAQFNVMATGLAGTTGYLLAVNGAVVQTGTSDTRGRLNISAQESGLGILDINSVALWDSASNVVISTTLP